MSYRNGAFKRLHSSGVLCLSISGNLGVNSEKNKGTQRVDAFKCLFYLESAFERTPSRSQFVLRFNSGLRIGFIRVEFDIRCREILSMYVPSSRCARCNV